MSVFKELTSNYLQGLSKMKANKLRLRDWNLDEYTHFKVQRLGLVTVIHLADRKLSCRPIVDALVDELHTLLAQERPDYVLLNFGFVAFCSSELISALIDVRSLVVANKGQLKLCGMREEILSVFQILHLDGTLFDIHDSASGAVRSFVSSRRDRRSEKRRFPVNV